MIKYILNKSLKDDIIIQIIYMKKDKITERNIKVKEISEDKVKAYCYLRREIRYFKIENILSAKILNDWSQK
jgi:predicted DNA-binding transcriptional regulator YafY